MKMKTRNGGECQRVAAHSTSVLDYSVLVGCSSLPGRFLRLWVPLNPERPDTLSLLQCLSVLGKKYGTADSSKKKKKDKISCKVV